MRIGNDDYTVEYDPQTATATFTGVMRLNTGEYTPIAELLARVTAGAPLLILDLRGLTALNSSGITSFARFLLTQRMRDDLEVRVRGSDKIPWQPKSLANFKLLLPNLKLEWDG